MMIFKRLAVVAVFLVLSGCYMPIRFDSEIDINRSGYYTFIFDGYLAKVELYQDLKDGKIDREEELLQVQQIKRISSETLPSAAFSTTKKVTSG